jgi:hypothetical protein
MLYLFVRVRKYNVLSYESTKIVVYGSNFYHSVQYVYCTGSTFVQKYFRTITVGLVARYPVLSTTVDRIQYSSCTRVQ